MHKNVNKNVLKNGVYTTLNNLVLKNTFKLKYTINLLFDILMTR